MNESHEVHNAQEFENRFWTIFAVLFSTAVIFAKDSPLAFGLRYPSVGFIGVLFSGYGMHIWDRNMHRLEIGKVVTLKKGTTHGKSLDRLHALGIPIEDQLCQINTILSDLDQFYIPSTFNNLINKASVMKKEREIINIFEEAEKRALNYLIGNLRLALLFYKIKDHRSFNHQHRTQLIELLSIERISQLTVYSRVIVLHALQMMKLPSNTRAEFCVSNIFKNTTQDDLSDLKTLTDSKGSYFCMTKLIYDDIKSDIVRDDILKHIEHQSKIQYNHMAFSTRLSKERRKKFWRKVLSDVDDTLTCSGGAYPSGIDKRYGKKVVYPGVLGFYRELDLGTEGPEEWPEHTVGNLVFLSARPHIFKDVSEKINFKKFEKLLTSRGMHTMPSLLAGDVNSGLETLLKDDYEPLAQKKFDNFRKYVAIYPEFRHVFICDNGQGDVRAAELMIEAFPRHIEAIYVQIVQKVSLTYKYSPERWEEKGVRPFFFKTYPEAALDAAKRNFIRTSGLRRICIDAINDFYLIQTKDWPSEKHKSDRRDDLNQALWSCNEYLRSKNEEEISLLDAERIWKNGQKVKTPFGYGTVLTFDKVFDLYTVSLDWRPINTQIAEHEKEEKEKKTSNGATSKASGEVPDCRGALETVFELDDEDSHLSPRPTSIKTISTTESIIISSINSTLDNSILMPPIVPAKVKCHQITAKLQARCISKYVPPVLPRFPKDDTNKKEFSFWSSRGETSKGKSKPKLKPLFTAGDKCSTPFGPGVVVAFRDEEKIVVLKMTGWTATCYLSAEVVKSEGEGFFGSLFRKIKTPETKSIPQKRPPSPKDNDNPCAKDSVLLTPFGEGRVTYPKKNETSNNVGNESPTSMSNYQTIGISLTSWTLANNTHPTVYCTEETALHWKTSASEEEVRSKNSGGLLSAFGSIVSLGKKLIKKKVPSEITVSNFEQFYADGAAVLTPFGNGRVEAFRANDGFYEVSLVDWKLANNSCSKIYVTKDSLTYQKAIGCHEGYAVLTSFGLTGILESVQQKTGVHIVTIPLAGMVCYLQPKDIIKPLKAVVGDDALTPYGNGQVIKYRISDNTYQISLCWGATLYAQAEAFDRDSNHEDRNGLNMSWVFRLFFSVDNNSNNKDIFNGSQRSRSNSVASLRTQNPRNILS